MTTRRAAAALFALGLALFGASYWVRHRGEGYTSDPLDRVRADLDAGRARLVDVREPSEWRRGHVRGATSLPLSVLQPTAGPPPTAADVSARLGPGPRVIYTACGAGPRALKGAETLRGLGFDARALHDGYAAIVKAGFPDATGD